MVIFAFILMGAGGLLFAEMARLSQRGLQGLDVGSGFLYDLRGVLQLLAVLILLAAVAILFLEKWWLGLIGLVVAWLGTVLHVVVFTLMDSELKTRLSGRQNPGND